MGEPTDREPMSARGVGERTGEPAQPAATGTFTRAAWMDEDDATDTIRDYLIVGLRDAHAMESQAISLTSTQAERLEDYPELQARMREHLRETEGQRDRLERCLDRLDTSHSTFKDVAMKTAANLQAMFNAAAPDEVVKNTLASYAFEHFEIASYKALITVARMAGQEEVAEVCRQNLQEEERMAQWLDEHLPEVVEQYLQRRASDEVAKR
jgi:ferritin-like metal-binding protein YciE